MNVTTLFRVRPRLDRSVLPRPARSTVRGSNRRRKARTAVIAGFAAVLLAFVGFDFVLDHAVPQIRDPEYGRRASRWHARVAEQPKRPVVLVLGSSRVSMGVRPAAWEAVRPEGDSAPLLTNMAVVGGGPMMQLMYLKRILAERDTPDAILFEYWPPFLRGDHQFAEQDRIDPLRLGPVDRDFVQTYYREPEKTFERMHAARLNPFLEYRHRIIAQLNPRWLKWNQRLEVAWENLDPWGWLPGVADDPPGTTNRQKRLANCRPFYRDQFEGFNIAPMSDRAFADLISLARARGIRVGLLFLPESPEFRAWYPPEVERDTQAHLATLCRTANVPVINARLWMGDDATCDGFHLFRGAAGTFTERLGPAVMEMFPDLKRRSDP